MATNDIAVTLYNVHADHIDTARVITRQDHAIVWRWDAAEAFGATGPDQNPSSLGAFLFNQRFPGQVFDQETGLFQNWNREYNARAGRYIQSDPIGLEGGNNTFSYVDGNPIGAIDPRGLLTVCVNGVCTDTSPPLIPPNSDYPQSPAPGTLAWPKLLPDSWVDKIVEWCTESRSRGERGATGGTSGKGTDNPYKHCRLDPKDARFIICTDHQTGKKVRKPTPPDWYDYK